MYPLTEIPPRKKSPPSLSVSKLIKITELCIKHCFFKYDNIYNQQKCGIPMGSPLTGVLATFFENFWNLNLSNAS